MPYDAFVGVDPGVSGGIAAIDQDGVVLLAMAMPTDEQEILSVLKAIRDSATIVHAVLERVGATPKMGVVSAFTFGKGVGVLRMALIAARIPFTEVRPQSWQADLGCLVGTGKRRALGEGDKDKKNRHKRRASELFPDVAMTHAKADALLMAEFCRRLERRT